MRCVFTSNKRIRKGASDAKQAGRRQCCKRAEGVTAGAPVCATADACAHNSQLTAHCKLQVSNNFGCVCLRALFTPADYNFDAPAAVDEAALLECLDALRQGEPYDVPVYDFTTHARSATESRRVEPAQVCAC
jgi:Phosphoribulokinase / Uridine kinase family